MPLAKLLFKPGQNAQLSPTANEGGWSSTQLVRFRDGLPQKVGGWVPYGYNAASGFPRSMHAWQQLDSTLDIAVGTHLKLYIVQNQTFTDITPIRKTSALTGPFATVSGTPTVTVTDSAHGASVGNYVEITSTASVGGLTISGEYTVISVVSANQYTITAASNAGSTASGGGTVSITYLILPGPVSAVYGTGVGANVVGYGLVGTPRTSITLNYARTWALANWGEYLLAVPSQGNLYSWLPSGGVATRAAAVTNGTPSSGPPLSIGFMFIGMPERHCILLGCSDLNAGTNYDPMLVRFSDVEDYTSYLATAINSAGSYRLQGGTRLICGLPVSQTNLIWSDNAVFSMRFIGAPYYYRFDRLGSGCGIVGPRAMAEYNGVVYWMGTAGFYSLTGSAPQEIDCLIYQQVFGNINLQQGAKIQCGINSAWNEAWWFYPSASSSENDTYAVYNYAENLWYSGTLTRSVWIDRGIFPLPLAMDSSGVLYQHETGTDANGSAMDSYIESGFVDIGDGTQSMFVDRVIPDFGINQSGTVYMTIKTTDYPNASTVSRGPYPLTPTTQFATVRARGRQVSVRFESTALGDSWRLGAVRAMIAPDGKR